MSSSRWTRFRARASRPPIADQYEPLRAETWSPIQVYVPQGPPRALLFFTKPFLYRLWMEQGEVPPHLFAIIRYGIPTLAYWKLIKDTATRLRLPLCFVGDLDPLDLTAFVALRCGDPDLKAPHRRALPITFGGIDDRWLELCERGLLPARKGALPLIRMSEIEQEHRDVLFSLAPWLEEQIGPRCAELLRSGLKLELEGASNPDLYRQGFTRTLLKHLLKRAR
jgi:hypothetical protein